LPKEKSRTGVDASVCYLRNHLRIDAAIEIF